MCEVKEEQMKRNLDKVRKCIKGLTTTWFQQIPKEENAKADILAKTALVDQIGGDQIKVQYIPSIDIPKVNQIDGVANWTTPIMSYLKDGLLPEDKEEARKLRVKVAKFVHMDEVLYRRGFSQPYLWCLTIDESHYILMDVHKKACRNHVEARSLVYKIVCAEYYQSSMQANAKAYVKVCDKCQRYRNIPRQPSKYLTLMVPLCPFAQWALDILGPFPMGTRQMRFFVVGIDYFTKWGEAEPLAKIIEQNFRSFV